MMMLVTATRKNYQLYIQDIIIIIMASFSECKNNVKFAYFALLSTQNYKTICNHLGTDDTPYSAITVQFFPLIAMNYYIPFVMYYVYIFSRSGLVC